LPSGLQSLKRLASTPTKLKRFSQLYAQLDASTSTLQKIALLQGYFSLANEHDAAWACYLLAGGKLRQVVPTKVLRAAVTARSQCSPWLFEECYQAVGDLAETIAHLLPAPTTSSDRTLSTWIEQRIVPLRGQSEADIQNHLIQFWDELSAGERFTLNKLLTGGFRVGVSRSLVTRALAHAFNLDAAVVAQRFVGYTDAKQSPTVERFNRLITPQLARSSNQADSEGSLEPDAVIQEGRALPFFLAHPIKGQPQDTLGLVEQWQAEWKWDGIRAQLVVNANHSVLWSRGEELLSESFPELMELAALWSAHGPAGTILDGEILIWDFGTEKPQGFQVLQQRTTRKNVSTNLLKTAPAVLMVYDCLAANFKDMRASQLTERRAFLEQTISQINHPRLRLSPLILASDWGELELQRSQARALGVEGLMLKRKTSAYGVGRSKTESGGEWWKWKLDPYSIDAVLIYAQAGHGRRASLYTDYTFAVWSAGVLVPFAKAYSGLTDQEIRQVDAVIKKTTIDKFGPVRSVTPTLVFELGFEGIAASARHKSGVAVRFPRILRWRTDKPIDQANSLEDLKKLAQID
jgi:DNA ligase 1